MSEHKITGWKKYEVEIKNSPTAARGMKESTTDVLALSDEWRCECGEVFDSESEAKDHLWRVESE